MLDGSSRLRPIVIEALLWFLGDLLLLVGEFILGVTRVLNTDKHAAPVVSMWFVLIGLFVGAISAAVVGQRVTAGGAFLGVSMLASPVALGAVAHLGGRVRPHSDEISHIATWYGGAALGFGLAAGRFGALRLLGQV